MVGTTWLLALVSALAGSTAVSGRPLGFDANAPAIRAVNGSLDGELYGDDGKAKRVYLTERQNVAWNYGTQKVRGVNIGGWLVAEPWITPSLFDNTGDNRVVDEYTFGQYVGDARSRLQRHWDTFITESDFQQIKAAGLNHVRIPIGFWAFQTNSNEPYVRANQLDYLRRAVGWASKYGLKVMIDLHGAPQSQNGFDNSGQRGSPGWFNSEDNKNRAKACIVQLAQMFSSQANTVTSIQLLNEPLTTSGPSNALSFTQDYYNNAYYAARYANGATPTNFAISIHDGFQPLSTWSNFLQPPAAQQVILDTHIYTMFDTGIIAQSQEDRLRGLCARRSTIGASQPRLWTVVGEWTSAFTDCAKYLNGRGVGARYDGSYPGSTRRGACDATKTGDGSRFSATYKGFLKRMFDTQRNIYETGSGWFLWTWKAPQAADWSYQAGLAGGWITRNLDSRGDVFC